jgi:hypothetical protein
VQRERKRAVDFFTLADVTRHSQCSFHVANSLARSLGAGGVAREQYDPGSLIGKDFGDGFANAHGSPGYNYDFSVHFHGDSCIA